MKHLLLFLLISSSVEIYSQQPTLFSPLNNSVGLSLRPTFLYTNAIDHTNQLQISYDGNFTVPIYINGARCPTTIPPGILVANHTYYWRVVPILSKHYFPPSDTWTFTTTVTNVLTVLNFSAPAEYKLYNNYPNPFNPVTNLKFDIAKSSFVKIRVFDLTGKVVSELVNKYLVAGEYETAFNATDLSSGMYFYRLETEDFSETKKMFLIK
ncbi:hypothetical protein BH10BAC5_BH10BAC5_17620 [soil metagenome]